MSNTAWSLLIVALLIAMTVLAVVVSKKLPLVAIVHNGVWALAIFLIGTDLVTYKESGAVAWVILICGLLFFNLGCLIAQTSSAGARRLRSPATFSGTGDVDAIVTRRTLAAIALLYSVGFVYYLISVVQRFGLEALLYDPSAIRGNTEGLSYLAAVPLVFRLLLYLGPVLFALLAYRYAVAPSLSIGFRVFSSILIAVSMMAMLQRTNLFLAVLLLAALMLSRPISAPQAQVGGLKPSLYQRAERRSTIQSPPKRKKGQLLLAFIAAALLIVVFQTLGGALGKTGAQALSTGAVSPALNSSGLTSPFVYFTAGTVAFLQLTESTNENWPPVRTTGALIFGDYNPQTWGAATFSPVLKAIPGSRPWSSIAPFIDTGVDTNVYTWFEPYYRDFRIGGVAGAMFIYGFLATMLFKNRVSSVRMYWLQAALLSTIILAPFASKVNNTLWLAMLGILFFLSARSAGERKAHSRKSNASASF